jgi:hypothetical protein
MFFPNFLLNFNGVIFEMELLMTTFVGTPHLASSGFLANMNGIQT